MKLISERLEFRNFTKEDFPSFYSIFSNEQVMRYAWIDKFNSEDEAIPFFEEFINSTYAYAVFSRDDDTFIGVADIQLHTKNSSGGCGEIGYFLLPDYWGKGYASELAKVLIEFGFTKLNLHKMCAKCNSNNLKSEGIMIKVGMTKEGELRKVRFKEGKWDDEKQYGILIEEWKERMPAL